MADYESWVRTPVVGPTEDDCNFCDIAVGHERSLFDRAQPLGGGSIYITPAYGMMLPGYFLAVTRAHNTSFAQRDTAELADIDDLLTRTEHKLEDRFDPYFRVEHGSDEITECGSGGCIVHAHQHLIPADGSVGEYVQEQLPWQQLDSYEDISEFQGTPYIYLGRAAMSGKAATHYVVPNPRLPGQWIRRQVAHVLGPSIREIYGERCFDEEIGDGDWLLHAAPLNLSLTMMRLRAVPRGRESLTLGRDELDYQPSEDYTRPWGCQDWVDIDHT